MAKEKKEKKEKRDKDKDKKSSSTTKVDDPSTKVSKKKKDRKDKDKDKDVKAKLLRSQEGQSRLLEALAEKDTSSAAAAGEALAKVPANVVDSLIVPFARPLAREKSAKKVLKAVKRAAKAKCLKRGVKEVVKALRKSASGGQGLVVLAADISPIDVISHIPVLCEDHDVPYVFVTSRAELGAAGSTKRPTSVVMLMPGLAGGKKKKGREGAEAGGGDKDGKAKDDDAVKEFAEAYDEAVKIVRAETDKLPSVVAG